MEKYDVLVAGGGPGGVPAAIAAARLGARTALAERFGYLGGMATAGLINPFMGYWAGDRPVIRGIFAEITDRLRAAGALHANNLTFDEEALKLVLDEMVREAAVETLFHTTFVTCSMRGDRISKATFVSKGGPFDLTAKVFVDATGDADLAAAAGAKIEVGRPEDGLCQPMTLCFRIGGIDRSALPPTLAEVRNVLDRIYLDAKARGEMDNPREDILLFPTLREDVIHFNTTRIVAKSPLDPRTLTEAEFDGRRQMKALMELFRREAPGFAGAFIEKSAAMIGVRESRRVMGEYVLDVEDVIHGRKFDDAVACSTYPVDIHNPAGTGTVIRRVPKNDWYEIPYRAIVPLGVENLVMAGRAISATHEGHSSLRVMPVVAAIGQAAGTAAAMAAKGRKRPRNVDAAALRAALRQAGAFVGDGR